MKTLLLIDANSLIHRAFHALPPLTAPDGRPTQALYGLGSILIKLWREERPDFAAALFDRPEPTFRKQEYEDYKAHRPPTARELVSQIIEAHELFKNFGIPTFEIPGFEADDLIATLAERFKSEPNLKAVILTGDLDTLQLVEDEKIVVRTPKRGISETVVYDEAAVQERYGLLPSKLADYKALVGDPSDNIKGLSGVGPKTASELLGRFESLEDLLQRAAEVPKLKDKLAAVKKYLLLAKRLVTLNRAAPLELSGLGALAVGGIPESITPYFEGLGFATLLKRLKELSGGVVE